MSLSSEAVALFNTVKIQVIQIINKTLLFQKHLINIGSQEVAIVISPSVCRLIERQLYGWVDSHDAARHHQGAEIRGAQSKQEDGEGGDTERNKQSRKK